MGTDRTGAGHRQLTLGDGVQSFSITLDTRGTVARVPPIIANRPLVPQT
jgi:hypothetical protein